MTMYMPTCAGEDYGGLNDRIIVGGAAAFAADAERWRAVRDNTLNLTRETILHDTDHRESVPRNRGCGSAPECFPATWNTEYLHLLHMRASRIEVRRANLAYCIITSAGACKYFYELVRCMNLLPLNETPALLRACRLTVSHPERCNTSPTRQRTDH